MKVLDQQLSDRSLTLRLTAPAGSEQTLFLRINGPKIRPQVAGAKASADLSQLHVEFPSGNGYVEKVVTLSW
jgi:hypothetical protein